MSMGDRRAVLVVTAARFLQELERRPILTLLLDGEPLPARLLAPDASL
jgi:hypothetical protein